MLENRPGMHHERSGMEWGFWDALRKLHDRLEWKLIASQSAVLLCRFVASLCVSMVHVALCSFTLPFFDFSCLTYKVSVAKRPSAVGHRDRLIDSLSSPDPLLPVCHLSSWKTVFEDTIN